MAVESIGVVGSASAVSPASGVTNLAVTVPAGGVAVGSVLVAHWGRRGTATSNRVITDSKGNTWTDLLLLTSGTNASSQTWISYITTALAAGDVINLAVTNTSAQGHAFGVEAYSGADGTYEGLDRSGVNSGVKTWSTTNTSADNLPVMCHYNTTNNQIATPSGWTHLQSVQHGTANTSYGWIKGFSRTPASIIVGSNPFQSTYSGLQLGHCFTLKASAVQGPADFIGWGVPI